MEISESLSHIYHEPLATSVDEILDVLEHLFKYVTEVKAGNEFTLFTHAPGYTSKVCMSFDVAKKVAENYDVLIDNQYWDYDPLAIHFKIYLKGYRAVIERRVKGLGQWVDPLNTE